MRTQSGSDPNHFLSSARMEATGDKGLLIRRCGSTYFHRSKGQTEEHVVARPVIQKSVSKLTVLHCSCWIAFSALLGQSSAVETRFGLNIQMNKGQAQVNVTGVPGTVRQVQYTDNLSTTGTWFHVGHCVFTNSAARICDTTSSSAACRFYRAVWSPSTNLVWISPGTFKMGSPTNEALRCSDEQEHTVTISRGFWMSKYLVTQRDYLSVTGTNPSYFTPVHGYDADLSRPVEGVSWFDAVNYCALLTQQERVGGRIPSNCVYRLPTESEWEYACRAGTSTAFFHGNSLCSGEANFDGEREYKGGLGEVDNPGGTFVGHTVPVGSYAPNGWGLYDMDGNVFQWCQDWQGEYPAGPVTDPQGPMLGVYRIWRGGSWGASGQFCRSAQRLYFYAEFRSQSSIGIRLVLSPSK